MILEALTANISYTECARVIWCEETSKQLQTPYRGALCSQLLSIQIVCITEKLKLSLEDEYALFLLFYFWSLNKRIYLCKNFSKNSIYFNEDEGELEVRCGRMGLLWRQTCLFFTPLQVSECITFHGSPRSFLNGAST